MVAGGIVGGLDIWIMGEREGQLHIDRVAQERDWKD